MSYKYTTRIRPLNLILIRSINEPLKYQSYEKPSTSLICFSDNFPFSNASTCIYCFHSHFRITWIQCMLLFWYLKKKKIIFSFISGNLFVVWPFCFAFSILHWFYLVCCHSDSFLFMCGWICEGVGLRCSPRRTLCPSCSSPVVPSINVSCPSPQKMLGNNVIVFWGHDICMVAWENPSHGHIWCYIFGKLQASLKWNVLLFCTDPQTWKRGKLHLNISFQFQSKTPHLHLLQNLLMEKKLN